MHPLLRSTFTGIVFGSIQTSLGSKDAIESDVSDNSQFYSDIRTTLSWVSYFYRYMNRPVMKVPGLYDPTIIMNSDQMNRATREGWVKLAFYLLSFFYYLYGMISSLIAVA